MAISPACPTTIVHKRQAMEVIAALKAEVMVKAMAVVEHVAVPAVEATAVVEVAAAAAVEEEVEPEKFSATLGQPCPRLPAQATFLTSLPGDSPSATSFQMNPQPGVNFQLALSKDFISIGIAVMTGSSSANLTKGAKKPFLTIDLASVIPEISKHFSIPQPLVVKIRDSKFPLVSMNSQGAMVKQSLFIEVCTPGQNVLDLQAQET
ncbi:uncharacterized protein LOC143836681 [Paroedura picta]|uniref:uncharacterized protein LOC143836681 n=1 Tax=Paroedura picta TaxID=143630 RepID=UPI00405659EE